MVLLQFLIAFCLPLISLGSIDESTDINKSKKIQIVYIKVPLVTNKLRNNQNGNSGNNLMNEQPNGDKSSYSMSQGNSGNSGKAYMSNSGYNGPPQTGSGFIPNYDYPSSGLNNQGSSSYTQSGSFSPYTSSSNSYNDVSGNNKKPLFSSSSSPSYDQSLPHPNSIVSPSADSQKQHKPAFPFPLNLNGPSNSGYSGRGININNGQTRPTGFQGFDKNFNQDQRFNQGPINLNTNQHNNNNNHVINPVNTNNMNNPSGNANFAFNYGNNYDKGQPFNGPSLPLGLMGSSNGFMGNLKPSDGLGNSNGLIKPMGSTGKLMKPGNLDDGLGSAYGAASTDPLPYGSNEAGDPMGPSYNPSDFFGPSATSGLDTGLDDFTGFGDMTFDNDALLNFGGMQPFTGDLGMEANKKKNKGYGSFMSSALSGLGSFGFLSGGGSSGSNGLTSNYNPMKGMAVAMSNTFPSFTGPKQQVPNHGQSGSGSSSGGSSSGFGGIRTRLTNLLTGRLPSLNFASLTGLGSLGGPSGMTGLGGMNSGLLGLFGL